MSSEKSIIRDVIRGIAGFLKWILSIAYYSSTSIVPVYVFASTLNLKNSFIYAIAISGISIVIMDIVCSIVEDIASIIYKIFRQISKIRQRRKQKVEEKRQSQIEKLENLIQEKNDLNSEIEAIYKNCLGFEEDIKKHTKMPKDVKKQLISLCERMEKILEDLEEESEEYYPIRQTFRVIFPKFQKWTYSFMNIAKTNSLDEETIKGFRNLIAEFNIQLDYVKGTISLEDKLDLNVGTESLVRTLQTERKNGDT